MNKFFLASSLCILMLAPFSERYAIAQTNNCTQTIRLAQSIYEQGRLQEIQEILKSCVDGNSMSIDEKVTAYKLLCLTKIYLEEPEEADKFMLLILQTNHEFRANPASDPAEFVSLFKTFRSEPIYRFGGKAGATAAQPHVISADKVNDGKSEYGYNLGYAVHAAAEIPLSRFSRFTLNPELGLQNRSFSNTNTQDDFVSEGLERQNWLTLPVSLQYSLGKVLKFDFYVSGGLALDFLLASETTITKLRGRNASSLPEKNIDLRADRNALNSSLLFSAGAKKKMGKGYLVGEIRFQYGLSQLTNTEGTFSNPTLTFDYGLVDSSFKLNTLSLSVGYLIDVYNPKKLSK